MSVTIYEKDQYEAIKKAGKLAGEALDLVCKSVKAGMSTWDLDQIAEEWIRSHGAIPTFKGYMGFPASLCTSVNHEVVHGIPSKQKILLVQDAGFGEEILDSKKTSEIPIFWIDNNTFVFPYYPITKNKATIIEIDLKAGAQIKLGDINDMPKANVASFFKRDPDNNLLYICPKGNEIIDLKSKGIKTLEYYHCGNKFDAQVNASAAGRIIKFQGKDIGKYHCDLSSVQDCKAAIALEKKMKIENEVYPQGLGVWNVHTKKWTTINVDNVASVIGWVEE